MLFGFESVGGYDSLIPQRTAALLQVIAGNTPEAASEVKLITAYTPSFVPKTTRFDLLPRLGITTMVVPPNVDTDPAWNGERVKPLLLRPLYLGIDGQVITIVSPKPVSRAYVVHDAQFASTPLDALQQFVAPGFEYSQRVILETPVDAARSSAPSPNADASPAVKYDGPNHVSIDVTTTAPGWVVLTDMWGPGWHATMNGKATDVLHANYAFRAVRVPAGQTHIDMRYQPTEFTVGAAITSATIVAIGVVFIVAQVYRWRKKRLATTEAL